MSDKDDPLIRQTVRWYTSLPLSQDQRAVFFTPEPGYPDK